MISEHLKDHIQVIEQTINKYSADIKIIADECIKSLENSGKIIIFGNGGSAADAQHMVAELVGSFTNRKRQALAAIALTTDTSVLTSISNDYSYDEVFSRQLSAFASEKDVVIGISTSGISKNIIKALQLAKERKCFTVGLSGNDGNLMNAICDKNIVVCSNNTSRIQETHIFIEHSICYIIDKHFLK